MHGNNQQLKNTNFNQEKRKVNQQRYKTDIFEKVEYVQWRHDLGWPAQKTNGFSLWVFCDFIVIYKDIFMWQWISFTPNNYDYLELCMHQRRLIAIKL